jgi:membrane-associated phospholipid phosphatase
MFTQSKRNCPAGTAFTEIFLSAIILLAVPPARAGEESGKPDTLRPASPNQAAETNENRYRPLACLAAGGGLAFALDGEIRTLSQKSWLHGHAADDFFDVIEPLGRDGPYYYFASAMVAQGLIFENQKSVRAGGELAVGMFAAQGVTWAVKHAFGRKRPYEVESPYVFFKGGNGFYSGHAATAFTAATILSLNYPRQNLGFLGIDCDFPLVPAIAYSLAGMVAAQRLYSNVHWSSDVYFGALAGYAVGRLTVYLGEKVDIRIFCLTPGGRPGPAVGVRFLNDKKSVIARSGTHS